MSAYVPAVVRIYLLDDHDIVRRGLRDLLAPSRDIEIVGDSGRTSDAHETILRLEPDVMLLDLQLQDGSGIEVCRRVRSVRPRVRGIFLTAADEDDALVATALADAEGYVVKVVGSSDILQAIRRVGAGRPITEAWQRARARELVLARASSPPSATPAELDLLEQVVAGSTDAELAVRYQCSLSDVENSVAKLARRLVSGIQPAEPTDRAVTPGKHRRD